jgi:hypothetical protein
MANYKQIATSDVLTSELAAVLGVTVTQDVSGSDPILTVGTVTTQGGGVSIKILDQLGGADKGWDNIVGSQQPVYTGTTYQVVYEPHLTAIAATQFASIVPALLGKRGGKVEIWTVNSGQSANFSGAGLALKATIQNNIYWPVSDMA